MSKVLYYGNGIPPGVILPYPAPLVSTPSGFLPCNGANYDADATPAYVGLYKKLVTDLGFTEQVFTYSATNILSKTSHGFLGGELIQLRTSGTLSNGLTSGTFYYVVYINADTFSLSITPDSATIVSIMAAGSGTHSYKQSLFGLGATYTGTGKLLTVPDLRGVIPQGIGASAGFVQSENLGLGQRYNDRSHGHEHGLLIGTGGSSQQLGGPSTGPAGYSANSGGYAANNTLLRYTQMSINGVDGTPRTGNTTRPKVMGLNWIIKF